ncbi:hypothetical protein [Shewanella subflava]|uniref:Uncharacterized protein n=1 Tax=Shewanella subflava TaxID=2986476 RepID=A0ABT3I970_9GAMM|nr:hypothetical protein [Shewanella subflava]MCW3172611.1 hypothetical protein [Shewanella subflava]
MIELFNMSFLLEDFHANLYVHYDLDLFLKSISFVLEPEIRLLNKVIRWPMQMVFKMVATVVTKRVEPVRSIQKYITWFNSDTDYAQGWSDGFRQCEIEQESIQRQS